MQYWGWFLAFGIALLLLGVVAVVRSVTATIISMRWLASSVRVWRRGRPSGDGRPLGGSRTSPNGSAFHADPRASGTGFGATFGISVSIDTSRYQQ